MLAPALDECRPRGVFLRQRAYLGAKFSRPVLQLGQLAELFQHCGRLVVDRADLAPLGQQVIHPLPGLRLSFGQGLHRGDVFLALGLSLTPLLGQAQRLRAADKLLDGPRPGRWAPLAGQQVGQPLAQRHPKRRDYQVRIKDDTIVIFERQGPDIAALQSVFGHLGPLPRSVVEHLEQAGQYIPIMRFILIEREQRVFAAQRWYISGSIDNWVDINGTGQIADLARTLVPRLGTDAYVELY